MCPALCMPLMIIYMVGSACVGCITKMKHVECTIRVNPFERLVPLICHLCGLDEFFSQSSEWYWFSTSIFFLHLLLHTKSLFFSFLASARFHFRKIGGHTLTHCIFSFWHQVGSSFHHPPHNKLVYYIFCFKSRE